MINCLHSNQARLLIALSKFKLQLLLFIFFSSMSLLLKITSKIILITRNHECNHEI